MWKFEKYTAIFLLVIIFGVSVYYGKNVVKAAYSAGRIVVNQKDIETAVEVFDNSYKAALDDSRYWVDAYGGLQKLLGKREIKNFQIVSDEEGSLYTSNAEYSAEDIEQIVADIKKVSGIVIENKNAFLFVQVPYKNYSNVKSLEGYGTDYTEENFDSIVEKLTKEDVALLDLRTKDDTWDFYKTDHHWKVESAFDATISIVEKLNVDYQLGLDADRKLRNKDNYEEIIYPSSLLGSAGIQVGKYYSGLDDFVIPIPKFDTNLIYEHFVEGEMTLQKSGDFQKTFVDKELLEDKDYYNKYNACLYGGYNENIIVNKNSDNNYKCLFISHSYGRPLVQYLSLYFGETRYLDPQEGRYNDSIIRYIENYEPDVVIVMYDGKLNIED